MYQYIMGYFTTSLLHSLSRLSQCLYDYLKKVLQRVEIYSAFSDNVDYMAANVNGKIQNRMWLNSRSGKYIDFLKLLAL